MPVLRKIIPYGPDQLMDHSWTGSELLDHFAYSVMHFNTSLNKQHFNAGLVSEIRKLQPNPVTDKHRSSS